jgi:hypothetical protein
LACSGPVAIDARNSNSGHPLSQDCSNCLHHRPKIEPFVRPIRTRLNRCVQGVDDPNFIFGAAPRRCETTRKCQRPPPPRRNARNPERNRRRLTAACPNTGDTIGRSS